MCVIHLEGLFTGSVLARFSARLEMGSMHSHGDVYT